MIFSEHETRPEGERAVLFFRQTYSVRLYETEGKLYSRNACDKKALKREVFLQASDLARVFSLPQMVQHISHTVDLSLASSPEGVQRVSEMPKQARQLVTMLLTLDKLVLEEKELKEAVDHLASVGTLKTKSEPWKIWSFYAPQLYDLGLGKYQGRRLGDADDGGEEEAVAA